MMVTASDGEIYEKHAEELLRFATVLVGPDAAADVLSSAVLRAIEAPGWETVDNPRAYLFRCVTNEAKERRRSMRRRQAREIATALPEIVPAQEVDVDVVRALLRLSTRQRAVVYLAYWADCDHQKIAELLGISTGAVHRHLARARAHLRRLLSD